MFVLLFKMRMKNLLLVFGVLIFSVSFVSAGSCQDTGCPPEWCATFGEDIICDGSSSSIDISDDKLFCPLPPGDAWVNYTVTPPIYYNTIGENPRGCFEQNPAEGSTQFCCPEFSECDINISSPTQNRCIPGVDYCSEYNDADRCNNDTSNAGRNSVELLHGEGFCSQIVEWHNGSDICFNEITCGCEWNYDTEYCSQKWSNNSLNCFSPEGGCVETFVSKDESGCDLPNGKAIFTFESEPWGAYSEDMCQDGAYEVLCSRITRLPFFGFFNIISVAVILIVFYCFRLKNEI